MKYVRFLLVVIVLYTLLSTTESPAQIKWNGNAASTAWSAAANWVGGSVPTSSDSVVLDNSVVSGSYDVILPAGTTNTTVKRIRITPTPPNIITLIIPSSNTATAALTIGDGTGDAYDFRLDSNAVFKNSSGGTSGTGITFANAADSIWLANGASWIHNSTIGSTGITSKLSRKAGTEFGLWKYDVPGTGPLSMPASGQVFGSLTLSGVTSGFNGTSKYNTKKYIRAGGTAMTIRGNYTIESTVRDSSTMTNSLLIGGDFTNNGYIVNSLTATQTFIFNGKGLQYINGSDTTNFINGITISSGATVILNANLAINMLQGAATPKNQQLTVSGTLKCGTHTVNGVGDFILNNSGTLSIGSSAGISATGASGNILVSGTKTYNTGANYSYEGSTSQATGDGLPATVNGLTINNGSGVTLNNPVLINGTLTLSSGLLNAGNNTLTLGSAATIAGTPSSVKMITLGSSGRVKKILTSATPHSFTFPVGDNTGAAEYSPVNYTLNSGTFSSDTVSVGLQNIKHPSNVITAAYLNRYWTLSSSGVTNPNYTAQFTYTTADIVGTESSLIGGLWKNSAWSDLNSVNTTYHSFTAVSQTAFGDFTAYAGLNYLSIKVIPQGFYNIAGYLNQKDTISAYLANASSPYAFIDTVKLPLDSLSFSGTVALKNKYNGNYYVVIKQKSSLETWSAAPISFASGTTTSYDFTTAQSQAYGNNLIQVSSSPVLWAIYSGDINHDGYIDPLDLSLVDQASFSYMSGRNLLEDINGDGFVDPLDLSIVDQNSFNYVGIKRP